MLVQGKAVPLYIDGKMAGTVVANVWADGYVEITGTIDPVTVDKSALDNLQVVNMMPEGKPKH